MDLRNLNVLVLWGLQNVMGRRTVGGKISLGDKKLSCKLLLLAVLFVVCQNRGHSDVGESQVSPNDLFHLWWWHSMVPSSQPVFHSDSFQSRYQPCMSGWPALLGWPVNIRFKHTMCSEPTSNLK